MHVPLWAWAAFVGVLLALLTVDLLAHRRAHVIGFREAAWWSVLWVSLGLGFALVIWAWQGPGAAGEYTAAYLLEKSLSVDNLFVFALIFSYFRVPRAYQHRVLFYGVLGALVLRFLFIAAGIALLDRFSFVIYLFGAFLIYTAVKMVRDDGVNNWILYESRLELTFTLPRGIISAPPTLAAQLSAFTGSLTGTL